MAITASRRGLLHGAVGATVWLLGACSTTAPDRLGDARWQLERVALQIREKYTALGQCPPPTASDEWVREFVGRRAAMIDPWDRPLQFRFTADERLVVSSAGPDGIIDTHDDMEFATELPVSCRSRERVTPGGSTEESAARSPRAGG